MKWIPGHQHTRTDFMHKQRLLPLTLVLFTLFATACTGDYRDLAEGDNRSLVVVMDSTQWQSATAEAIRETFGKYIFTLPNAEPTYKLNFRDFSTQAELDRLKKQKNIIFAAPIDEQSYTGEQIRGFLDDAVEERVRNGESFAFPVEDIWYRDQIMMILSSSSDSLLARKIRNTGESLIEPFLQKELKRWTHFVYAKKEQVQYSDSLWDEHGFKVRIQHDYYKNVDTLNFISYRRFLPQNDRWMWVWWKDNVTDASFLNSEWINATRDSLSQQFIKGGRDDMYVKTYYSRPDVRPVITKPFEKGRYTAFETLGTWHMVNGAMAGPFVNFTYYDPATQRIFMIEYSQFAPSVREKLPFVRQFQAMGRTFEADSTYNNR